MGRRTLGPAFSRLSSWWVNWQMVSANGPRQVLPEAGSELTLHIYLPLHYGLKSERGIFKTPDGSAKNSNRKCGWVSFWPDFSRTNSFFVDTYKSGSHSFGQLFIKSVDFFPFCCNLRAIFKLDLIFQEKNLSNRNHCSIGIIWASVIPMRCIVVAKYFSGASHTK